MSANGSAPASPGLIPLQDIERSASRLSGGSTVHGSEAGTVFSASTAMSNHTPAKRVRMDLGVGAHNHKMVRIEEDHAQRVDLGTAPSSKLFIWGTRLNVEDVQREFRDFIQNFQSDAVEDDEHTILATDGDRMEVDLSVPYYMELLRGIDLVEVPVLNLNLGHILKHNESLYKMIIAYPSDIIPYLDGVVNEIFDSKYRKQLSTSIEVRPYNAELTKNMRELNPEDIDQLITTTGMVTRVSPIIPEMSQGFFQCSSCKFTVENLVNCGQIDEPVNCSNCGNAYSFQLIHNRSIFLDKQLVKLQEIPGDAPAGQTQHTVTLFVYGNLVENVHPGDRVSVTGIYRAAPIRLNPQFRAVKSVYRTYIDVIHFRRMNRDRLHGSAEGCYLTEERIEECIELSKQPDVIDRLVKSLAPTIFGHDGIKKGILCLLFGGCRKSDEDGNHVKLRSEINVLLCGDPGTAKSQLLRYVYELVPRSQYTSGKGSSAVGLSASITRDPDHKGVVLQTGALVLADNGVCCIDEFDKMNEGTRSILHEVMEQQTLSIAKAGIICQLNARTSILAAANPIDSKWNKKKNIIQNVHLPHTLLSRFDLIFLVLDPEDEEYDRRLSKHLINFYLEADEEAEKEQQLDMAFLRDYIDYAKENIFPKLTQEVADSLIQKYLNMRAQHDEHGHDKSEMGYIAAYPRQLESLIRISEAFAKMRLCNEVSLDDVENAYDLYKEALRQSAMDPITGLVNVAIIASGATESFKRRAGLVADAMYEQIAQRKGAFSLNKLYWELRSANKLVDKEIFDEAVSQLIREEVITRSGDKIRVVGKRNAE